MTKIEELEQKIETINIVLGNLKLELENYEKALAELKESKKEKRKPKSAEEYWFRNTDKGEIESICRYEGDGWDDWRVNNIPIFKTKEECERYWHFIDTVKEKSYSFSKEEWEKHNIRKYTIYYDFNHKEFGVDRSIDIKYLGEIYFKTEEDCQYIIDNFKDELLEFWL